MKLVQPNASSHVAVFYLMQRNASSHVFPNGLDSLQVVQFQLWLNLLLHLITLLYPHHHLHLHPHRTWKLLVMDSFLCNTGSSWWENNMDLARVEDCYYGIFPHVARLVLGIIRVSSTTNQWAEYCMLFQQLDIYEWGICTRIVKWHPNLIRYL